MKIEVGNRVCKIIYGGADNLINVGMTLKQYLMNYFSVYSENYEKSTKYNTIRVTCTKCFAEYVDSSIQTECRFCDQPVTNKRAWNGKIYYINPNLTFKTGLLEYVYDELLRLGYNVDIVDNRTNAFDEPVDLVTDVIKFELRDDQVDALNSIVSNRIHGLYFPRGIVDAAMNYGKTALFAATLKTLDVTTLIVVNKTLEYKQLFKNLGQMGIEVGTVDKPSKVTVAMDKTLSNRCSKINVLKWLNTIQCLIVDEAHSAKSPTIKKIVAHTDSYSVLFTSGTILDSDNDADIMDIVSQSGTTLVNVTMKELMDSGISQNIEVRIINYSSYTSGMDYQLEIDTILRDKLRMLKDIVETHSEHKILIMIEMIRHGITVLEFLKSYGIEVEFVHGEDKERDLKLDTFIKSKNGKLISTMILNQGVDISDINVGINLFGGKSIIRLKQFLGRIYRQDGSNNVCYLYDFKDTGKYSSASFKRRLLNYETNQLTIIKDFKINDKKVFTLE